jgi:hypothetical protein
MLTACGKYDIIVLENIQEVPIVLKSKKANRIKFETWMDKKDVETLDTFAREKGMTRSAASRYIIMDYIKNKAPYNIKEDPQVKELREAIISLNTFPAKEIKMPDNVDPVIAEGVRRTVTENMELLGLNNEEFSKFIEIAIKSGIKELTENNAPEIQSLRNYYYEKAKK